MPSTAKSHRLVGFMIIVALGFQILSSHPVAAIPVWKYDPLLAMDISLIQESKKISVMLELEYEPSPSMVAQLEKIADVNTVLGKLVTLRVMSSRLQDVAAFDFVKKIGGTRKLWPQLDVSVPDLHADAASREKLREALGTNVDGSGTIIGFVDTGIDWKHPDFYFANGTTKILYIWDQSGVGPNPEGFGYGEECTSQVIMEERCTETDPEGHGTHVAGIAASTGRATGKYQGVAPGAGIIFVRAENRNYRGEWYVNEVDLVDGLSYIMERARALGKTPIVNLSLGSTTGSHDDTDTLEIAMNDFVRRGMVIVVSAGNARDENKHIVGNIRSGESITITWSLTSAERSFAIDLWYSLFDSFRVDVRTPSGILVRGPTTGFAGQRTADGNVAIEEASGPKGREWVIAVFGVTSDLRATGWSAVITGLQVQDGKFDAYFGGDGRFHRGEGYSITEEGTIGVPGTASLVITVGAHVTKTRWTSANGSEWIISRGRSGQLAYFSGVGPTRDGRMKPDVVAPGLIVASARSSLLPKDNIFDIDTYHTLNAGTSMSAPHVAGLAALILQVHPDWTPGQVKFAIRNEARTDRTTGSINKTSGSPLWGWGKADALTSIPIHVLSVTLLGLPADMPMSVWLDETFAGYAYNGSNHFKIQDLTAHTIRVEQFLNASTEARYTTEDSAATLPGEGQFLFTYHAQYRLTVVTPYGRVVGDGWYDADANATVRIDESVPLPGLSGLLGGKYVFAGWSGNSTANNTQISIIMDSPKTFVARWKTDYTIPYVIGFSLPVVIAAFAVVSILRPQLVAPLTQRGLALRAIRAPKTTGKFCMHCGQRLPADALFCAECGRPQPT